MMKKINSILAAAALVSGLAIAGAADAAVTVTFTQGGSTTAGYSVIQDFNTPSTATVGLTGSNYVIHSAVSDSSGSAVNNSPFLSVLGGGTATYTFASPVTSLEFDWGTASLNDTLTILTTLGNITYQAPNSGSGGANYNMSGLLTATATSGLITGLTFSSAANSFEVDNIAVAVPEPASWAMMIGGFGLIGAVMRRRGLTTALRSA